MVSLFGLTGKPSLLVMFWVLVVAAIYIFYVSTSNVDQEAGDGSSKLAVVPMHWKPTQINAIVLIAASNMAEDRIVDYSIASIRRYGGWKGAIYVITDRPTCFKETIDAYQVDVITIPKTNSIIEIKSFKTKMMNYLPKEVTAAVYIDVDILVTKDLSEFLYDAEQLMQSKGSKFDYAMFLDAAGHYIGFCNGCEKWHTGVIVLKRDKGETCMAEWEKILLSGAFATDQESIDEAERVHACPNSVALPSKHLMFAKDYLAIMLTSSRTFLHMTGAGRLDEQDFFYRMFAVPHFRSSLPKLDYTHFVVAKTCE
jgi:hypothetical protein